MLKAIEEFTHERHAIRIERKLRAVDVIIDVLTGSFGALPCSSSRNDLTAQYRHLVEQLDHGR
jgi:hypothetical protein